MPRENSKHERQYASAEAANVPTASSFVAWPVRQHQTTVGETGDEEVLGHAGTVQKAGKTHFEVTHFQADAPLVLARRREGQERGTLAIQLSRVDLRDCWVSLVGCPGELPSPPISHPARCGY